MEIVTIEKKTFELWKQRFENFVGRVDALCVPLRRKRAGCFFLSENDLACPKMSTANPTTT